MELRELPVGACIRDQNGRFCYYIAAQEHPGYAGTTLLSAQIVLIGVFDAAEAATTAPHPPAGGTNYGNHDFAKSNLLQWLNCDRKDWFVPSHAADTPPVAANIRHGATGYANRCGYLAALPAAVRNHLLESQVPVHSVDAAGKPAIQYVRAKVFLPSRTELAMGNDYDLPEGLPLPLLRDIRFRQATLTEDAIAGYCGPWKPAFPMRPGGNWRYWLRSPHLRYPYLCRYVGEMGGLSFAPAYSEIIGCRPMMNVSGDLPVQRDDGPGNIYFVEEGT